MSSEMDRVKELLEQGVAGILRRTMASNARQRTEYAPENRWQEQLWELRLELPERYPLYVGGRTALQEELPTWIAALEKELAYSKRIQSEMYLEFDEKQAYMMNGEVEKMREKFTEAEANAAEREGKADG